MRHNVRARHLVTASRAVKVTLYANHVYLAVVGKDSYATTIDYYRTHIHVHVCSFPQTKGTLPPKNRHAWKPAGEYFVRFLKMKRLYGMGFFSQSCHLPRHQITCHENIAMVNNYTNINKTKKHAVLTSDQILRPLVMSHFDDHSLTSRPILMDENVIPHRVRIMQDYLQQEAI